MKDALKNIGADVAEKLLAVLSSDEGKKFFADTKAASDSETGTFEVVITTENLDRYQEVISLAGWELEHYRNNPIVLWGHDHNQPIGMATSVEIADGKMVAKGKFAPTEKAQEIRRLYDFGVIKATSVGFIVKEQEGNLITKAELLEFSFVSVPANPYALSLAMEKGLSVNDLVTKGMMFVEKEAPAEEAEKEIADTDSEEAAEPVIDEPTAPVEGEKSFGTKQLTPVIEGLKAAVLALEALDVKVEEPEGEEAVEQTEDEKAFADFNAKRKTVQDAATMLGDILADMRRVSDARKAS